MQNNRGRAVPFTLREVDWRLKARLAVVSLHLEEDRIAADMSLIDERPDPVQRTIFIDEFAAWHGDITKLAKYCGARASPALRSGLCLAVGSIPAEPLTDAESDEWKLVFAKLFSSAPDGGTHSAAGWALRQWKTEAPALTATSQPSDGNKWFVNSLGMTLLEIQPGEFVRRDETEEQTNEAKTTPQKVKLTRAFFLSDREVSVGEFQQFIRDEVYPNEEKPADWQSTPISPLHAEAGCRMAGGCSTCTATSANGATIGTMFSETA